MRSDEEKEVRSAAAEYVQLMEAAADAKRAADGANSAAQKAREDADKAKDALLRLVHVGRNRRMRVITMSPESGLAVVVEWREGASGKLDDQGGYAVANLVGIDGEPR